MSQTLGWARARPSGAENLRRGAWYPVLSENASDYIVVSTVRCNVKVSRHCMELRAYRPVGFSVVFRMPNDRNPVAGTDRDLGLVYGVCPWSGSRVGLMGFPDDAKCPNCGFAGPVLWDDAC